MSKYPDNLHEHVSRATDTTHEALRLAKEAGMAVAPVGEVVGAQRTRTQEYQAGIGKFPVLAKGMRRRHPSGKR